MDRYNNIYMLGVKGFGMSSLAALLKKMGKNVWGSDIEERLPADELLEKVGIKVLPFGLDNVTSEVDLLITTGSHGGLKNPEVLKAQEMGIPTLTHAEALGKVMDHFTTRVAVCGTHGKTTVSALLAYLLVKMDVPCGYQVGAPSFSGLPGGDFTGDHYFVVESDEYVASPGTDNTPRFMFQNPTHTICMNIEHDHVDVYKSIDDIKNAFQAFFEKIPHDGSLIYCADDLILKEVASHINDIEKYGYGFTQDAYARISNVSSDNQISIFSLHIDGKDTGQWETRLSGEHNIRNITGVLVFLYQHGFNLDMVKKHLINFTGSKRRFEHIYDDHTYTLIDDYAHHPTEIRETINGARLTYPGRRLIVFFQPHTFSRTEVFKEDFVEALSMSNQAFILDIYASARESAKGDSIRSQDLSEYAQSKGYSHVQYVSEDQILQTIQKLLRSGDVILTMGATDIYRLHNAIIDVITSKSST